MTPTELLDRESIRDTLASYTMAGDRLRLEEFIAVFTEDAILETDGIPEQDAFRYQGRNAIHAWMNRWRSQPAQSASEGEGEAVHQATFVRHHLGTCHISFDSAHTARTRTYWTAYTDIGPDHAGVYVDVLRKVSDRWLIAHRKIRLDWRSPQSLMFTAITNTR